MKNKDAEVVGPSYQKAPFIAIARHRLAVDGEGVTTLVAFHGCPLRCRYCLNDMCLRPDGVWRTLTTEQLLQAVSVDNLYFLATGGGVTFGGGEPCLRSEFIDEFCRMRDSRWRITIETSLNVDLAHIKRLVPHVNQWIVDIKDTDPVVYESYTSRSNKLTLSNLRYLLSLPGLPENIMVRLPLIPEYNTADHVVRSRQMLQQLGVIHFDEFKYIVR